MHNGNQKKKKENQEGGGVDCGRSRGMKMKCYVERAGAFYTYLPDAKLSKLSVSLVPENNNNLFYSEE